jgi:hypothetical protein
LPKGGISPSLKKRGKGPPSLFSQRKQGDRGDFQIKCKYNFETLNNWLEIPYIL